MKLKRVVATEVVVPARQGTINGPGLERPLHKLAGKGRPAWSIQFDEVPKLLLRFEWEDGLTGLGECYRGHDWETVEALAGSLLGRSLNSLPLQNLPIARCREYDGFECAVWDSYAKAHEQPLVDLLGGPLRRKIPVGAWSGHRLTDEIAGLACSFAEQGYNCIKFKCDLEDDVVTWCREIDAAAPGIKVILDPNERWERASEARTRLKALSEVGNVLCVEDPIPRWMLDEYLELRRFSAIPIVLHVSLPYAAHGQKVEDAIAAIKAGAVDGFNFNGGLARYRQLDSIAAAAALPSWHGSEIDLGILEAAYLHKCAAAQSCTWPSDIFGRMIRSHDLLTEPLRFEPPFALLPEGPGLGVTVDERAVAEHRKREVVFEA
jgi:muconate cycloisomerase